MSKLGNKSSGFEPSEGLGANTQITNLVDKLSTTFDGINDYTNTNNNVLLNPESQSFSISFWFKTDSIQFSSLLGKQVAFGYSIVKAGEVLLFSVRGATGNNAVPASVGASKYTDNKWHHLVCTYIVGGEMAVYFDGVKYGSASTAGIGNITENTVLSLCAQSGGGGGLHAKALLDEVIIWKGSYMTGADVLKLYNQGLPTNPLDAGSYYSDGATKVINISLYYKMGDGDVYPFLTDNSAHSNIALMINMSASNFVADVPT